MGAIPREVVMGPEDEVQNQTEQSDEPKQKEPLLLEIRENIYLGNKDAYKSLDELREKGITAVVIVADDLELPPFEADSQIKVWKLGIRADRMNPPHVKDLAVHSPKYMTQNGEKVLIQSVTGLERGAYVICRLVCELEQTTIYEVMQELKEKLPEFDINKSYF